MEPTYSIAIETSCRRGGVALGRGEDLLAVSAFDASYRQAGQLVCRLDEILRGAGLAPRDVAELYVSAGPGSFTGLRVGITVARTLAQATASLRLVAVPTIRAVAANARDLSWRDLGVVMDYKDGDLYAGLYTRAEGAGEIVPAGEPALMRPEEFLARAPRPLLLIGEALEFAAMQAGGVDHAPAELHLPTPEGVWRVGRRLAAAGVFTDYRRLLPLYSRKPEAVRLWEKRNPA
jgi:tRNA threonylcarbamoyladenosine biosynthesis protein TsaB